MIQFFRVCVVSDVLVAVFLVVLNLVADVMFFFLVVLEPLAANHL